MLVRYLIRRERCDIKIIRYINVFQNHFNIILIITDDQKSGICDAVKAKISSLEKENIELRAKITQLMEQNKGM